MTARRYKAILVTTAQEVVLRLRKPAVDCAMRLRLPRAVGFTNTAGWRVAIGDLGKNRPRMEIWLDRFTGLPQPHFWFGFTSDNNVQVPRLAERVSRRLRPHRLITVKDVEEEPYIRISNGLTGSDFGQPTLERYSWAGGEAFYGIYIRLPASRPSTVAHVAAHATGFFAAVACAAGRRRKPEVVPPDYVDVENRARVASHIARERSSFLPMQCKLRDRFICQVCGMRYRDVYGELGAESAEAHHIVPLSTLKGATRTRLADLITVCADCHRMLHRMHGEKGDIPELALIVRRRGKGRARRG